MTAEDQLQELLGAFFTSEVHTGAEATAAGASRAPTRADDDTLVTAARSTDASIATGMETPYGDESASLVSGPAEELGGLGLGEEEEDEGREVPLDLDEQVVKLSGFLPKGLGSPGK